MGLGGRKQVYSAGELWAIFYTAKAKGPNSLFSLVVSQKAATTDVPFEALGRTHSFYISTQKLSFISPQKQFISG